MSRAPCSLMLCRLDWFCTYAHHWNAPLSIRHVLRFHCILHPIPRRHTHPAATSSPTYCAGTTKFYEHLGLFEWTPGFSLHISYVWCSAESRRSCQKMISRRRQHGAFFLASSLCMWSLFLSNNGIVDAANVDGRIHLPRELGILEPTKVVLNQGDYTAFSRFDGSFRFHDVPAGIYVVSVLSTEYHFGDIKIDVRNDGRIRALLYAYPGAPKAPTAYPLVFRLQAQYKYFVPRPELNMLSIFKHPMILMMVPMMLMMFCLPKMMENMDPEEMKQMKAKMKKGEDPRDQLPSWLGGTGGNADSDED